MVSCSDVILDPVGWRGCEFSLPDDGWVFCEELFDWHTDEIAYLLQWRCHGQWDDGRFTEGHFYYLSCWCCRSPFGGIWQNWEQRWAKGTIDRSSDTDSIFQFYRMIQSVDVKFQFLYRPIVLVCFEFRFFNRPILFLGLKFRLLYCAIVKNRFTNTLFVDNLISFSL